MQNSTRNTLEYIFTTSTGMMNTLQHVSQSPNYNIYSLILIQLHTKRNHSRHCKPEMMKEYYERYCLFIVCVCVCVCVSNECPMFCRYLLAKKKNNYDNILLELAQEVEDTHTHTHAHILYIHTYGLLKSFLYILYRSLSHQLCMPGSF